MRRLRRDAAREAGFTLVELLVAVVLMGIVVGPLAAALVVAYRSTGETTERMAFSHDITLLTAYLRADLASASEATSGDCALADESVGLAWRQPIVVPTGDRGEVRYAVSYGVVDASRTGDRDAGLTRYQLVRRECRDGSPGPTRIVARDLLTPGPPASVVRSTVTPRDPEPAEVAVRVRHWDRDTGTFDLRIAIRGWLGVGLSAGGGG